MRAAGNLSKLERINLGNNSLSGNPSGLLCGLPGLLYLNISFNHLNGAHIISAPDHALGSTSKACMLACSWLVGCRVLPSDATHACRASWCVPIQIDGAAVGHKDDTIIDTKGCMEVLGVSPLVMRMLT